MLLYPGVSRLVGVHIRLTESPILDRNHHLEPLGSRARLPAVVQESPTYFPDTLHQFNNNKRERQQTVSTAEQLKQQKSQLRRSLRNARNALSKPQQELAGQHLEQVICHSEFFLNAQHIAIYLANDGEIDPHYVLTQAVAAGKSCYLPVLTPEGKLWFSLYQPGDDLQHNHYGIPEPKQSSRLPAEQLDLVLMPLVGFDRLGGRLGMGGGFYDKTFEWIKTQPQLRAPKLLGLAHHCQEVERLELASWDIPLSAIATDKELITV